MPFSRLPPRVLRFLLLALTLSAGNTVASTLAATQFLSVVGSEGLPLYYVLFAVLSIPVSLAIARAVDRVPRIPLLVALAATVGGIAAAGALAADGGETGTTAVYLGIAVFEQLSYSVFYVLLADHFTSLEVNRHSGLVSTAAAGGGLVGGGLVWAGTFLAGPQVLLLAVPLLAAVTAAVALWILRTDAPAGEGGGDEPEESLVESLRSFPRIMARHPIALLIAAGVLLNQLAQCIAEFQAFDVYERTFPEEQDLAAFLGLMNAGLNLVGLLVSAFATTPLIRRFGIGRMNLVFPLATLAAFVWLSLDFALPAAIFAHVVYDAIANAVDQPVMTGNYNAVPHRFVARIRVVADGIVYPFALAGAGALLLFAQARFDPLGVSLVGIAVGVVFVAAGAGLGRLYRTGLLGLLREGAVELDAAEARAGTVPDDQIDAIRALLRTPDPEAHRLALELVARTEAARLLGDIAPVLPRADPLVRRRLADRVRRGLDPAVVDAVRDLARSPEPTVRALAVDVLLATDGAADAGDLAVWLADPDPEVTAVAAVGLAVRTGDPGRLAEAAATATPAIRLAMVHATAAAPTAAAIPVLGVFVADADPAVRVAALDAVRRRAEDGRPGAVPAAWARAAMGAADPGVRATGPAPRRRGRGGGGHRRAGTRLRRSGRVRPRRRRGRPRRRGRGGAAGHRDRPGRRRPPAVPRPDRGAGAGRRAPGRGGGRRAPGHDRVRADRAAAPLAARAWRGRGPRRPPPRPRRRRPAGGRGRHAGGGDARLPADHDARPDRARHRRRADPLQRRRGADVGAAAPPRRPAAGGPWIRTGSRAGAAARRPSSTRPPATPIRGSGPGRRTPPVDRKERS